MHWFLDKVEGVVIKVLDRWGLKGERDERGTGVWVGGRKIAQVGIGCSRWVTMHGFAVNVKRETEPFFREIVPCGIEEGVGKVTNLEEVLDREVEVEEVAEEVVKCFEDEFKVSIKISS